MALPGSILEAVRTGDGADPEDLRRPLVRDDPVTRPDPGELPGLLGLLSLPLQMRRAQLLEVTLELLFRQLAQVAELVPAEGDETAVPALRPLPGVFTRGDLPVPDRNRWQTEEGAEGRLLLWREEAGLPLFEPGDRPEQPLGVEPVAQLELLSVSLFEEAVEELQGVFVNLPLARFPGRVRESGQFVGRLEGGRTVDREAGGIESHVEERGQADPRPRSADALLRKPLEEPPEPFVHGPRVVPDAGESIAGGLG